MYSLVIKLKKQKEWRMNGIPHREKGPARIWLDEDGGCLDVYFFCGQRYSYNSYLKYMFTLSKSNFKLQTRWGLPAIIYSNGTKEWYKSDFLHRVDGPAIQYTNGDKEYWFQGKRHRDDGPAVIYGNKQYWFKDGEFIRCIV